MRVGRAHYWFTYHSISISSYSRTFPCCKHLSQGIWAAPPQLMHLNFSSREIILVDLLPDSRFASTPTTNRTCFNNTSLNTLRTGSTVNVDVIFFGCLMGTETMSLSHEIETVRSYICLNWPDSCPAIFDNTITIAVPTVLVTSSPTIHTRYTANSFTSITSDYFWSSRKFYSFSDWVWWERRWWFRWNKPNAWFFFVNIEIWFLQIFYCFMPSVRLTWLNKCKKFNLK